MLITLIAATLCLARRPGEPLRPGFNLFSKQQDIQLGQEAAAQVRQKVTIVQNQFLQDYVQRIGKRLTSQPEAAGWPFSFTVILDPSINAFALPGGAMFINTGAIAAADTEAQLAGVMGHEMSHVILRHGTNQASKARMFEIPAALAGAVIGNGSVLGQLTQLGIGLGLNSVLLSYSRGAESEADALGSHLMSEAGYNPLELAHFFEKLQSGGGSSHMIQFLSDHPNPGNREKAIEEEIQSLPHHEYGFQTGDFQRAKAEVAKLPKTAPPGNVRGGNSTNPAAVRPSQTLQPFQSRSFSISYPSNWQVFSDQNSDSVTIAPREALVQSSNGNTQIGYGIIASYFFPDIKGQSLRQATDDLIHHLSASNTEMQASDNGRSLKVNGNPALITMLSSKSALTGGPETDALLTINRPDGLFYLVFIAPTSEFKESEGVYNDVVQSVRFK
ncbi:MAG TPA: M48 family metallopeptidase [Bryobacteraceae bacterium]|nr:M48 family metallopeptidase [Bryobacteraceae bacterium]